MPERDQTRCVSERVYRALLVAYPRRFRDEYGMQMARAFAGLRGEGRYRGVVGIFRLWLRVLPDLSQSALRERSGSLVSSNLVRVGGLASMIGGALGIVGSFLGFLQTFHSANSALLEASSLLVLTGGTLVAAGLLGMGALPGSRSGKAMVIGRLLIGLSAVALAAFLVSRVVPLLLVGPSLEAQFEVLQANVYLSFVHFWGLNVGYPAGLAGLMLMGFGVFRARALGRWRALPLVLAFLSTPLIFAAGWVLLSRGSSIVETGLLSSILLFLLPLGLPAMGFTLLGYLLWLSADEPRMGGDLRANG